MGHLYEYNGAKWSPDGEHIILQRDPDALRLASRDGTGECKLVSVPGTPELPHWSPDGSRIAFFATTPGKVFHSQIYLVSASGG